MREGVTEFMMCVPWTALAIGLEGNEISYSLDITHEEVKLLRQSGVILKEKIKNIDIYSA